MTILRRSLLVGAALLVAGSSVARAQLPYTAIWGTGPNDVWAVGYAAALHYDGQAWREVPYGAPLAVDRAVVWGHGPNGVFVGGSDGVILHWNGQAWTRMTVPTERQIVALAGRSATEVYALVQSYNDREVPTLLRWNGQVWAPAPLPMPFRANGLALAGVNVLVAGFVMNDPTPNERRVYGVLARRLAARWVMAGWNGRVVTDPVVAGAGWSTVGAAGTAVLLEGERGDGERVLALSRGAAFTVLPAVPTTSGGRLTMAFLGADGVPVALLGEAGLARYTGGAWVAAGPTAAAAAPMAQAAQQNPMAFATQMAAWGSLRSPQAAWGSSSDFYAATYDRRIVRVQGAEARIVHDASCSDPQMAGLNPVCQAIQQQPASPTQPTPRPLPMPSVRVKPPSR